MELIDSDECEDIEEKIPQPPDSSSCRERVLLKSPSPPPDSPVQKQSRKVKAKLNEVNRRLEKLNSLRSPVTNSPRRRRGRRSPRLHKATCDVVINSSEEDDEVIMLSPELSSSRSSIRVEREFPLKVRCRADLNRIPVQPSTPLSFVKERLSSILGVPLSQLLLLREETELSPESTVEQLGLGIADIIECVVMADEAEKTAQLAAEDSGDIIKVRLQGKDRNSTQEFSLNKDAPLGSVFEQYLSGLTGVQKKRVRFHFDGSKVSPHQTPAQLDMEDGDIIEVWA